jgi:hypothetical protein
MTVYDSLHSLLDYECLLSHCDWFGSDLRTGHFSSFSCPLVNTPPLNIQRLSLSHMLRPTVSRPVCLGIKHLSGAHDQIFITVRQLRVCWCGAPLARERLCCLQLLPTLASAVILGFVSRGTRDHILLSQIWDFPFCRLLRRAGLRWTNSSPPPHAVLNLTSESWVLCYDRRSVSQAVLE